MKKSRLPRRPKQPHSCAVCESVFYIRASSGNADKFCSRVCYWQFLKGKPSPKKGMKFAYKPHLGMRGHIPWNKGKSGYKNKPLTYEARKKISDAARKRVAEGKHNFSRPGGGKATNERDLAKNTFEYKDWRRRVFVRDDYTCQMCGIRGGRLNADHIKPWVFYPKLRYNLDNGRTLCEDCHRATPTYGTRVFKETSFVDNT